MARNLLRSETSRHKIGKWERPLWHKQDQTWHSNVPVVKGVHSDSSCLLIKLEQDAPSYRGETFARANQLQDEIQS